jgi:hypothetical protein
MTIIEALDDPNLFKAAWRVPATWAAWRVFLKTLFALPMSDDELTLYRQCTCRTEPPQQVFREGWLMVGRRGVHTADTREPSIDVRRTVPAVWRPRRAASDMASRLCQTNFLGFLRLW